MDPECNWIIQTVQKLDLPSSQYAVFGSGLLDVLGLKKANDIDLIVAKGLFKSLAREDSWEQCIYPDGHDGLKRPALNVELFYQSDMPLCDADGVERMIQNAINIQGVRFVQLDDILTWKQALGREKDIHDIELIKEYMRRGKKEYDMTLEQKIDKD